MFEGLRNLRSKLTAATRDVSQQLTAAREEIRKRERELTSLRGAYLPRPEIDIRIAAIVQESGRAWLSQWGIAVLGRLGSPAAPQAPWTYGEGMPFGALCAGAPDVAERMLRGIIAGLEFEVGSPAAERPGRIAAAERELAQLEEEEEAAVDGAIAAGINIEHRPDVVQRRNNEARARELEAERAANRKQRQDAIDAAYADRQR